jgi:excinuclease UvrABC nuclease subunit
MSYVYRFIDGKGNIIYIGKTVNINNRMQQHFSDKGHLPKECYNSVAKIEYQKYKTESDSLIMETYYITKYSPKYNKLQQSRDLPTIEFNEGSWRTYKQFKPIQVKPYKPSKLLKFALAFIYLIIILLVVLKIV